MVRSLVVSDLRSETKGSLVIARLMSKCLGAGGSGREELKKKTPPSPAAL